MISGKTLKLGGTDFVIPPVPFSVVRAHTEIFEGRAKPTVPEMADIIFGAVHRNYPDLTQNEFEERHLDIANMSEVFSLVMSVSGAEEKPPSGEA